MSNSYKEEDVIVDKLSRSKKASTDLSYNLQLLSERVKSCIQSVDSSEIEDVTNCNEIIGLLNKLLENISSNQKREYKPFEEVKLTNELGEVVTEYSDLVVGYLFVDNSIDSYYKCRIVHARTAKEAIYKYKKALQVVDDNICCFGVYSESADYCQHIEDMEKID